MPSTFTPSLRLWEGTPGDPAIRNAWGTWLNTDMTLIESALLDTAVVSIAGLTTYALTTANGAVDQARPMVQSFTGALTANCTVTLPNVPKFGMAVNATTGGFNVILTSGGGTTVTIPPETLPYNYYCDGAGNVSLWQSQPGPRYGDYKFVGVGQEGGGWRMCYGQTRPRTDPLWQWITANGIAWAFGNGDGSTTYTMPDRRGRAMFGLDNMGGTAANRITTAGSGINGTTPGTAGGSQSLQSHNHTVTDPGHNHAHSDPGHVHGVSDPGHNHPQSVHAHGIVDPGHAHGVSDPGHTHSLNVSTTYQGGTVFAEGNNWTGSQTNSNSAGTGIGIFSATTGVGMTAVNANISAAFTGVGVISNTTGIANVAAATGVTIATAGTGGSQNMPPCGIDYIMMYVGA